MPEAGGSRINNILVSLDSYTYRLRIAIALIEEHNKTVLVSQATGYCESLLNDLLEAAEDAASSIRAQGYRTPAEARVGEDLRESDC